MTDLRSNNVKMNDDRNNSDALTTKQRLLQSNRTVVAASSAAVTSVLAGFPFDSIKTRMQTHYYPSMMSCVRTTFAEEGARGFFRGMIPPLITVSIIKSVSFSVYENTKHTLLGDSQGFTKDTTLSEVMKVSFLSGGVSGAFIALLSCPLELVKIQRQLEQVMLKSSQQMAGVTNELNASSWHAVKQIVSKKGVFGLWSGLTCHSARDALGTSIYFAGYETMKRILSTTVGEGGGPFTHFMSGGFCGILSWLFVFPVDAIKTNLQKDIMMTKPRYHGFIDCAISLVKMNGFKGLYRGLNVTLIRAFPIHSLNFLVYEQVLKSIPPLSTS